MNALCLSAVAEASSTGDHYCSLLLLVPSVTVGIFSVICFFHVFCSWFHLYLPSPAPTFPTYNN